METNKMYIDETKLNFIMNELSSTERELLTKLRSSTEGLVFGDRTQYELFVKINSISLNKKAVQDKIDKAEDELEDCEDQIRDARNTIVKLENDIEKYQLILKTL